MTPRVGRREWDSNPATTFAGLYYQNIEIYEYLDCDILFLKIIVTEFGMEEMGFEPMSCIHGFRQFYHIFYI
jgi:hypothetical protein